MPTIRNIAEFLNANDISRIVHLTECADSEIRRPATINAAGPGEIAFIGPTVRNPREQLAATRATAVILDNRVISGEPLPENPAVHAIIRSENARLDFIRVVERFFQRSRPTGVHPSAIVSVTAEIALDAYVGPLCTVGDGVRIGEGTVIHPGVHILDQVTIGRNVIVHSGSVIGSDGFGYERNTDGELEKFPHLGGVVIEDNVEIGANTCIDKGTLGDTILCRGAKIDNQVHVAHNVRIGQDAAVIANSMIGGSTRIGGGAWIAPSACLRERISIGIGATVGLASLVTKDVPDGATVVGSPAREVGEQKRILAHLARIGTGKDREEKTSRGEPDEPDPV